jgi:site-specific recombinase XerC
VAREIAPSGHLTAHTIRVLHGKGDKATTRGFHPSAIDALARWTDTRRQTGIRGRTSFCTLVGSPLHPQYVRNLLHRLGAKVGISKRVQRTSRPEPPPLASLCPREKSDQA